MPPATASCTDACVLSASSTHGEHLLATRVAPTTSRAEGSDVTAARLRNAVLAVVLAIALLPALAAGPVPPAGADADAARAYVAPPTSCSSAGPRPRTSRAGRRRWRSATGTP